MIICEKCETENENGSKFCKSCGSVLHVEPVQTVNPINYNSAISTVKKVAMWIGIAVVAFIAVVILINFVQAKKEDSQVRELRNACANNDAQACYELGVLNYFGSGTFHSEKTVDYDENKEALAKGCQLGNKNACRLGGYYERGCELMDGESCYLFGKNKTYPIDLECFNMESMQSSYCQNQIKKRQDDEKRYYEMACQYGYSQGCMEK